MLTLCGKICAQDEIHVLKTVIDTKMELTKSLAVSPLDSFIIVGGKNGVLKAYDIESGKLVK